MQTSTNTETVNKLESRGALLAIIATVVMGEGGLITMPYLLSAAASRYALPDGAAGIVTAIQFGAMAVASAAVTLRLKSMDRQSVALAAAVVALLANGSAILFDTWPMFILGRIGAGCGEGVLLAIGNAAAAATVKPRRTIALMTFSMICAAVPAFLFLPSLRHFTPDAVFWLLCGLGVVCLPLVRRLPGTPKATERGEQSKFRGITVSYNLIAVFLLYLASNSFWALAERIGVWQGLTAHQIGQAFVITVLMTATGPLAASVVRDRIGDKIPILLAATLQAAGFLAMTIFRSPWVFTLSLVSINVCGSFLIPYYRSLIALDDPSGRQASASVFYQTIGTMAGPFLSGLILIYLGGYLPLAALSAVMTIAAALLSIAALGRVARVKPCDRSGSYYGDAR